jgi:S-layer homology domain/IPT/TIG domain
MERRALSRTKDREGSRRAARVVVAAVALCTLTLAPVLGNAAPPMPAAPSPHTPPAFVWTHRTSGTTKALAAVAFAHGRFVAVGHAGTILLSEDGVTWTGVPSGTLASLEGVAFDGRVVAVGFNNRTLVSEVLTSADGGSWSEVVSPLLGRVFLEAVMYGGGKFVAVGTNGSILTSKDGIAWTRAVSGTVAVLRGVAYGGGRFVAVGEGGVISTSSDGVSWTYEDSGTFASLHGIAYGSGRFVAVGPTAVVTSADGVHWTTATEMEMSGMYAVAYGEGQFVAVGEHGSAFTSADGTGWVPLPSVVARPGVAPLLSGVTYGAGQYVAVAGDGGIWSLSAPLVMAPPVPAVTTPSAAPAAPQAPVATTPPAAPAATLQAPVATTPPAAPAATPQAPAATTSPPAPATPQAPAATTPPAAPAPPQTPAPTTPPASGATHQPLPAVVGITPSTGPSAGGTTITIAGSGMAGATQVTFQPNDSGTGQNGLNCNASALPAAKIVLVSDSQVVAVTPAVGTPDANLCSEDVVVTTPAGSSPIVWQDRFLYLARAPKAPTVASVSPQGGPASGGTRVTIAGDGFAAATGVSFGGVPAAFSVKSDTTIVAFAPPASQAAGTVDVTVTAAQLASQADHDAQFKYDTAGEVYLPGSGWSTPQARFTDLEHYPWAAEAIDALAARGVVQGPAPGRFDPSAPVTRAQFAVMAQRFFQLPPPRQPVVFTDVRPGEWDYAAVEATWAYIGASSPHIFAPGVAATRQDVSAAIVRILAARGSVYLLSAAEVQADLDRLTDKADLAPRLRAYAATAIREHIMLGYPDGSFKPLAPLTRAQAAVLLYTVQTHFLQTTQSSAPR